MRTLLLTIALSLPASAAFFSVGTGGCPGGSCDYSTMQDAIDDAACGDIFTVYSALEGQWVLKELNCTGEYVIIRGLNIHSFAEGVRVVTANAALLPDITVGSAIPIITAAKGADHYIIEGLEFKLTGSQDPYTIIQLFHEGSVCGCDDDALIEDLPHDIIWRKNIVRGLNRNQSNFGNCMIGNTGELALEDSSFYDCYNGNNREAHAFAEWNARGPIRIRNTYFEGSQIATLVGGAVPTIHGLTLTGYDVTGNYFFRPFRWRVTSGTSNPTGACAYTADGGGEWYNQTVSVRYWECQSGSWVDVGAGTAAQTPTYNKNQFELKNVDGSNVTYNTMSGGWDTPNQGSQHGGAVLLNQVDDTNPHTLITSINISYNQFTNTSWGVSQGVISGSPAYFQAPQDISIHNNVGIIGGATYSEETYPCGLQLTAYGKESFDHNTLLFDRDSEATGGRPICADVATVGLFSWNANIMHYGGTAGSATGGFYESFGGGGGLWNAVYNALGYARRQLGGNIWINQLSCVYNGTYSCPQANSTAGAGSAVDDFSGYVACPSCKVAANNTAMGFENYPTDLSIAAASAYYRTAQTGISPGADVARVTNGVTCTVSGCANPFLDMKINFITPSTTTASMTYTSYDTGTCDISVKRSPASADTFTDTDAGGSRARSISITGLSSGLRYMALLDCGGKQISQFFYTR
jgi:hypothetical protein